jgi:ribulose-phosphate 3-epimerase
MNIHVAPSILSADFAKLGEQVVATEKAGANRIHVDVMDGHFVPNLSMGPEIVKSLRPITRLPIEVHLMVEEPANFVDLFVKAGADSLIIHEEILSKSRFSIRDVRAAGTKVGVAVKPGTPVDRLKPLLADIDLALCMTVEPGFSGQKFLPQSPERIAAIRAFINENNRPCELEVDGGIDFETAPQAVRAGANVLVAATAIFKHPRGPEAATHEMRAMFCGG